jgi:hypothetical protein
VLARDATLFSFNLGTPESPPRLEPCLHVVERRRQKRYA